MPIYSLLIVICCSFMVNSFHKEFPYVKLKDAVACGKASAVVAIDFLLISKKQP